MQMSNKANFTRQPGRNKSFLTRLFHHEGGKISEEEGLRSLYPLYTRTNIIEYSAPKSPAVLQSGRVRTTPGPSQLELWNITSARYNLHHQFIIDKAIHR
jgi:hypothetical protein